MSTLIYCKNSIAANPFYIEEASLNVYSLEELSYFILNNVYLLSKSFMSVELCNWIGRELKLTKLSNDLLDMAKCSAPLHIFVGHILVAGGYASSKEVKETLAIIETFENKSPAECKKMRADRLMSNEKYVDAIYEYETLLSEGMVNTIPRIVEGDIYHNLGCAFSKLFFFEEATRCFDEAYKKNQKKQSLYCLLYAARCMKNQQLFDSYVQRYQVVKEDVDTVLANVEAVSSKNEIVDFNNRLNDLATQTNSETMFFDVATKIIDNWQDYYIKMCRI